MESGFKVLLVYKNSTYASYFLSGQSRLKRLQGIFRHAEIKRFKETHDHHFRCLSHIETVLKSKGLKYTKICRGKQVNYRQYNLVITVGGDGTFLEAARNVREHLILGVNSDPIWSVGNFCAAREGNFQKILDAVLCGSQKIRVCQRMMLTLSKKDSHRVHVLNDILVCHINPAAISRYYLTIGKLREEQRSSGLWIATAAGSSGAIRSAGGWILPPESKRIQYHARELYVRRNIHYKLKGGILSLMQPVTITSFMREGAIFVDGCHHKIAFPFGRCVEITQSPYPLKIVWS